MTKSLGTLLLFSALASVPCSGAWARKPTPPKTQYHWERMSITTVLPSQVFARLGLTHNTRYGFTRDGHTKKTPDPTFPPGLTDVVPYDATHLLLMRGTTQGLALFRARVLAAENQSVSIGGKWQVSVQLLPGLGGDPLGSLVMQDAGLDQPFSITVGDAASPHVYRLRLHVNANETMSVTYQVSLSPPLGATPTVVTPTEIWSPGITRVLLPDGTVTLIDSAADRQAGRRRLAMPDDADTQDYQIRLTVVAPPPPVIAPSPVITTPPAAPGPTPTDPDEENVRPHAEAPIMHPTLLPLLASPDDGSALTLTVTSLDGEDIQTGTLTDSAGRAFPIEDGIPRLLPGVLLDAQKSEIAARDAQVEAYDAMAGLNAFGKIEIPMVLRRLQPQPSDRLLEAGCGTGRMTQALASRVRELVAIDFSFESLRVNAKKLKTAGVSNAYLVQADLCRLPFASTVFDRIVSCQVLEHVPGDAARRAAVADLSRVAKPQARLVLSAYQHSLLTRAFGQKEGRHDGGIPFFRFTRPEFRATLSTAFAVESVTGALVYLYLARCRNNK